MKFKFLKSKNLKKLYFYKNIETKLSMKNSIKIKMEMNISEMKNIKH